MRAALLSIGSELMHGFLTDTNATFLTQELSALGVEVISVTQVGDDLSRIVTAFRRALDDADFVIASGGIGPTDDDLTREAVAEVAGETPEVDPEVVEQIRRFFSSRGIVMPEQNQKQGWRIPSSEFLLNPMGTAPGWFVRLDQKSIVIMPGVPREMFRMFREQAMPRILAQLQSQVIVSRTLKTLGIGESAVEREIYELVKRGYPTVATYAKDDGVHIRITSISSDREIAERVVAATDIAIRSIIGPNVYGYLDTPIASAILQPILMSGGQLAIWEAGSFGRLIGMMEESPLADEVIVDARVTSLQRAIDELQAPPGALTDLAQTIASSVAHAGGATHGAALVVRIAPDENPDRARGEFAVGLASPSGVTSAENVVRAIEPEIRRRATMFAADFLWKTLKDV